MKLYTVKTISKKLEVSTVTVYRWVTDGTIPHIRIGKGRIRFEEESIKEWITNSQIPVYNRPDSDYQN